MKFSIVTISLNQAPYLEQAIRSVLDQDYADVQYIVVDPGSTDGSRGIIDSYRERIDKIIFEPDDGPADGLNKGFSYATGDVYGFLNADDILEPNAISSVAQQLEIRDDIDVLSGHSWIIDEQGKRLRRVYSDRFSVIMAAYGACILVQPSTFFREEAFSRTGGFILANRSNWDGELFIDMSLMGLKFGLMDDTLSSYRVHRDSITGSARLHDSHVLYRKRMFRKIMGREMRTRDELAMFAARYLRKLGNPRDTYARLRYGPVYGRML